MYFNNIPQGFGQAPAPQSNFLQNPGMNYNQGIGGLNTYNQDMKNPANPAPQLPTQTNVNATPAPGNAAQSSPVSSTTGLGGKSITPLMPYSKMGPSQQMARGGVVGETLNKHNVVAEGIAALRGMHHRPREALHRYDETFGPDATAELMRAYATGGVVSGPGSGVADLVPGSIDGREDVRIASGEYVIPAWAVATLGDGSTEAGARVLDAMVARLREAGSELIKGTEPIEPNEFLPA